MLTSRFLCRLSDEDNTNTNVLYLSIRLNHLFFSIKEGSEVLVAPFESSTQLIELKFPSFINFDSQKLL